MVGRHQLPGSLAATRRQQGGERKVPFDCRVEEACVPERRGHSPRYTNGQREARMASDGPKGIGTTFRISGRLLLHGATCDVTDYEDDPSTCLVDVGRRAGIDEVGLPAVRAEPESPSCIRRSRPGSAGYACRSGGSRSGPTNGPYRCCQCVSKAVRQSLLERSVRHCSIAASLR
jgi:hypothetical protein